MVGQPPAALAVQMAVDAPQVDPKQAMEELLALLDRNEGRAAMGVEPLPLPGRGDGVG